jgi:hypothetical protein
LFAHGILPFLLVFVLIFAILQKTKILGEGKSQIDALVSLAIALILIGFPVPRDIIVNIIPWLGVALVVLLIFFLIYGFSGADFSKGDALPKGMKNVLLAVAIIFVVALVIWASGYWPTLKGWFSGDSSILGNVMMVVVVGVALWVALGKKD